MRATEPAATRFSDAVEDLSSEFEEVTGHVLARPEFRHLKGGTVGPLPMDLLAAGNLGWVQEIAPSPGATVRGPWATVYLFLLPRHTGMGGSLPPEPPLRGSQWGDFCLVEKTGDSPQRLLAIRVGPAGNLALVRPFAEALRDEFRSESEE